MLEVTGSTPVLVTNLLPELLRCQLEIGRCNPQEKHTNIANVTAGALVPGKPGKLG